MARPAKNHQIRINEILEVAEPLFYKKGYQQTTISDIVNLLNVAPGTIYYYFKSKDAILDTIISKHVNRFAEHIQLIIEANGVPSIHKLQEIIRMLFISTRHSNGKLLFEFLHTDSTLHMLQRIELQSKNMLLEPLMQIVQQGMDEDIFAPCNPAVLANIILALLYSLIVCIYNKMPADIFSTQLVLTEKLISQVLESKKEIRIYAG